MVGKEVTEFLNSFKDEITEFTREFHVFFPKDTEQEFGELRNNVKQLKEIVGDLKERICQAEKRVVKAVVKVFYNNITNRCVKEHSI